MLTRMNRSLVVATLLAALVLLAGVTAHADSVTFTGGYSGNPLLTINDPALGTVTGYIDPYTGTIGTQSVLLWCVDPNHDAPPVGTLYAANITAAGNLTGMSNTSQVINNGLSPSAANTLYGEMAYLIALMENSGNSAYGPGASGRNLAVVRGLYRDHADPDLPGSSERSQWDFPGRSHRIRTHGRGSRRCLDLWFRGDYGRERG